MVATKDKVDNEWSVKVLDTLQHRLSANSRSDLARVLGMFPSTLHRQESNGELPYRQLISIVEEKGWSLDEILGLKGHETVSPQPVRASDEKPNTEFVLRCCKVVTKVIEQYVAHPDVRQRRLSEARLSELRIDLVEVLMRIALDTQCNEVLIDATCRSILTIKQAY